VLSLNGRGLDRFSRRVLAVERCVSRSETSVPAPMKPIPPVCVV
jgi:hypothetical protein